MKAQFNVRIEVEFTLTKEQFKLLTEAIQNGEKRHEATIGNFWFGNMNRFNYSDDPESCFLSCTTRQLDTVILKSIEMHKSYHPDEEIRLVYVKMWDDFYRLLKTAIEKRNSLQEVETEFEV